MSTTTVWSGDQPRIVNGQLKLLAGRHSGMFAQLVREEALPLVLLSGEPSLAFSDGLDQQASISSPLHAVAGTAGERELASEPVREAGRVGDAAG